MAKREKFEGIKSDVKALSRAQKKIQASQDEAKCRCCHQNRGIPSLRITTQNGDKIAMCTQCLKNDINLSLQPCRAENISKLNDAISYLDTTIDTVKMTLNLDNPEDVDILSALAKCQFFLRNNMTDLVKGVSRRNDRARKQNNGGNREDNSWGKPIIR